VSTTTSLLTTQAFKLPLTAYFEGRPVYPASLRELPPEIARVAVFTIAIGKGPEDNRPHHETTVGGCESSHCELPSRDEGPRP
jgi:hypothetical protein